MNILSLGGVLGLLGFSKVCCESKYVPDSCAQESRQVSFSCRNCPPFTMVVWWWCWSGPFCCLFCCWVFIVIGWCNCSCCCHKLWWCLKLMRVVTQVICNLFTVRGGPSLEATTWALCGESAGCRSCNPKSGAWSYAVMLLNSTSLGPILFRSLNWCNAAPSYKYQFERSCWKRKRPGVCLCFGASSSDDILPNSVEHVEVFLPSGLRHSFLCGSFLQGRNQDSYKLNDVCSQAIEVP